MRIHYLDQNRKEKKKKDQETAAANFYSIEQAKKELERIRTRYKIEIGEEFLTNEYELFKCFLSMQPKAYLHFQKNQDIGRLLRANNFKDKRKTGLEKRSEAVIKIYDLYMQNKCTLKQHEKEL